MKLRWNELCPIHRSIFCCGREARRERRFPLGVQRIEDRHHPRGYRELRSPAEMRKLLKRKIIDQKGRCAICQELFTDYNHVVSDHIEPRGMGASRRDDHPDNIQAVHRSCNFQKGSRRLVIPIQATQPSEPVQEDLPSDLRQHITGLGWE
jgi:5-methylcytosine-specific restriction endonuclease McrA